MALELPQDDAALAAQGVARTVWTDLGICLSSSLPKPPPGNTHFPFKT